MYNLNIFGSCSKVVANLQKSWEIFGNVHMAFRPIFVSTVHTQVDTKTEKCLLTCRYAIASQ